MSPPFHAVAIGTPFHDPTSPLYQHSLRSIRTKMPKQDYFSHKPRSFVSPFTHLDEKAALSRDRKSGRGVGYSLPRPFTSSTSTSPIPGSGCTNLPRLRTLARVSLFFLLATLALLGWRCEAFSCAGRGGGALVDSGFVGGGSVVVGWGEDEGVDLRGIWGRERWGGGRVGDVDVDVENVEEDEDEEEVNGELVWSDEEEGFGVGDTDGDWEREEVNNGAVTGFLPLDVEVDVEGVDDREEGEIETVAVQDIKNQLQTDDDDKNDNKTHDDGENETGAENEYTLYIPSSSSAQNQNQQSTTSSPPRTPDKEESSASWLSISLW